VTTKNSKKTMELVCFSVLLFTKKDGESMENAFAQTLVLLYPNQLS